MIQLLTPRSLGEDADKASSPHVLLVVDQFHRTLGGGERIVLKLAGLLPQYGYRASILTFFVHPESAALQSAPCCPVYVLPLERTYDLNAFRAAVHLKRFLEDQQVQIVQTFFESSDLWAGLVAKATSSAKLIWSRRDMGILRGRKHQLAYRLMAPMPDAVFAVSELVRQYSIQVDRIDPARVQTIHNGLDLESWVATPRPPKQSGEEWVVTTLGNIRHVKGHDVFIKAAALVASRIPSISFSIAGEVLEPQYFAQLQNLVRDLGLSGRFHFAGGVTDLRTHFAAADIFVLPSRSEGFSNAIVEAMAASLPVVATAVGGNAEALQDGVSGLIVPPEDPEALADAILSLIEDPARAASMGAAGRQIVEEKFTTHAMLNKITGKYAELLGPRF